MERDCVEGRLKGLVRGLVINMVDSYEPPGKGIIEAGN